MFLIDFCFAKLWQGKIKTYVVRERETDSLIHSICINKIHIHIYIYV